MPRNHLPRVVVRSSARFRAMAPAVRCIVLLAFLKLRHAAAGKNAGRLSYRMSGVFDGAVVPAGFFEDGMAENDGRFFKLKQHLLNSIGKRKKGAGQFNDPRVPVVIDLLKEMIDRLGEGEELNLTVVLAGHQMVNCSGVGCDCAVSVGTDGLPKVPTTQFPRHFLAAQFFSLPRQRKLRTSRGVGSRPSWCTCSGSFRAGLQPALPLPTRRVSLHW